MPKPSMPRPDTHMPMTAPPEKAMRSAWDIPCWAAAAVRTLALVATCMPKNPASREQKAPPRKQMAACQLMKMVRITKTKEMKTAR